MTRQRSVAIDTAARSDGNGANGNSGNGHASDDAVLTPLATTTSRIGLDPLALRLLELRAWLDDDLRSLEAGIADVQNVPQPDLAERAANHLLSQSGKRIRPLCVIISARLGDHPMDAVVRDLAISAELVHAATLLHDDVIDMGTERRGAPTSRLIYGNSASILGGDHLLIEALRRVNATGQTALFGSLLKVITGMISAEALQLERRGRFEPDRDVYLKVVEGKTAVLFRWGLEAGSTVAGLDADSIDTLRMIGLCFGTAFQLIDDLLDLDGDPHETGKNAFADLREGKLTWPLIVGSERDPRLAELLGSVINEPDRVNDPAFGAEVVKRLREADAFAETRRFADEHADRALDGMQRLQPGRARDALAAVVQAAVRRSS